MNSLTCPICHGDAVVPFICVNQLPLLLFPVPKHVKDEIRVERLETHRCVRCNHIFRSPISDEDASKIYGEYYAYYPYEDLESMNIPYRMPFEQVFRSVFLASRQGSHTPKTLLEVGCASDKHLASYGTYGIEALGIDRSVPAHGASRQLVSGVYETYDFGRAFDVIVSRFSLEHLNDVHAFFQKARRDLVPNGLLFIQVPNVKTFAAGSMPLFLAHEHTHYFNPYSLFFAATTEGFELIEGRYEGSQSIVFALRKTTKAGEKRTVIPRLVDTFYEDYLKRREELANDITGVLSSGHCCFYGAGLTLCWILYDLKAIGRSSSVTVIDDNPLVQGRFLPNSSHEVRSLQETRFSENSILMLTLNPIYHATVVTKIRKLDYRGQVLAIDSAGLAKLI